MIDNTEVSTIKKITLVNVPQKFKELLKKFEYVDKETKETKEKIAEENLIRNPPTNETKAEDQNSLSTEQQIAFEKFKQGENLFVTGPGGT